MVGQPSEIASRVRISLCLPLSIDFTQSLRLNLIGSTNQFLGCTPLKLRWSSSSRELVWEVSPISDACTCHVGVGSRPIGVRSYPVVSYILPVSE